jgi:DNA polymerase III epsilon subunit family exonuclease
MNESSLTLIFFDLETTGLNPDLDEVIEIGAIKVKNGEVIEHFHSFVRPHRNIPSLVTNLTGITFEDVKDAPDPEEIRERLKKFLGGYPLIAHNVSFDRIFLEKFMGERLQNEFFDTLELSRIFFPGLQSHSLQNLVKTLSLKKEEAHRALSDTMMLFSLFKKISEERKKSSPYLLHRLRDVSNGIRHYELIFGDGWEKPDEEESDFTWMISKEPTDAVQLPFGKGKAFDSAINRYLNGVSYISGGADENLLEQIVEYAHSKPLTISVYNREDESIIEEIVHEKGIKLTKLENINRFICPKRIDEILENPSLLPDNFKMYFATLFSYLYKTRDFGLQDVPTHIIKNPLLRLLSFCDATAKFCEYEDVCPFKKQINDALYSDIIIVTPSFLFNKLNFSLGLLNRDLVVLNSYRLIKSFYLSKTGFSLNDFLFFAQYHRLDLISVDRIKEIFRHLETKRIGENAEEEANAIKSIFAGVNNPLLIAFFSNEYFWMEKRNDRAVLFTSNKSPKNIFKQIKSQASNILFLSESLDTNGSRNVLSDFTGLEGLEFNRERKNENCISFVPNFLHSPNREEFVNEFVSFFLRVHRENSPSVMFFSSQEMLKKVYFLLKRKGVNAKARGIDLRSEHGEVDLCLYDISPGGRNYEEVYFVKLPSIPMFANNGNSLFMLYSFFTLKNISIEVTKKSNKVVVFYLDGRFKNRNFRARFENDFISFPIFIDREQSLMSMLENWRNKNV